jgi:hypothetical protein
VIFAAFIRVLVEGGVSRVSWLVKRRRGQRWWREVVVSISPFKGTNHIRMVLVVECMRVWMVSCSRRGIMMVLSEIARCLMLGWEVGMIVIIALVTQI